MGKRSRAATKGLKPKKTITSSQRKARKINIAVARASKKKGFSADAVAKSAQARGKVITSYEASKAKKGTVRGLSTSWGTVFIKK